jgi:hypothetical protein
MGKARESTAGTEHRRTTPTTTCAFPASRHRPHALLPRYVLYHYSTVPSAAPHPAIARRRLSGGVQAPAGYSLAAPNPPRPRASWQRLAAAVDAISAAERSAPVGITLSKSQRSSCPRACTGLHRQLRAPSLASLVGPVRCGWACPGRPGNLASEELIHQTRRQ